MKHPRRDLDKGIDAHRKRHRLGYSWRLFKVFVLAIVVAPPLAFTAGLFSFASSIEQLNSPTQSHRSDAIVVLTGGAARISDALELLEQGHAERLLITGVHPDTSATTLARSTPGREELFACCVDLGYMALNTAGNAKEARDWALSRGYRSLIVVTSSYHLPRSLNELRREMPAVSLIPHPVVTDRLPLDRWWRNPGTTRLLLSEYVKYLMSILRLRFRPSMPADPGITTPVADVHF